MTKTTTTTAAETEPETKSRPLAVIAGATGYLGGHTARAAKRAGFRVRALARDPARLDDATRAACDEVFVGEATDPATIAGVCDGADVVFSSIGVRHLRRRPTIWEVDERANLNLVGEAERAGARRFVFVSVLGGPGMRARVPAAEARERVVDRLRASRLQRAVIRPSGFFNDMGEVLEMARRGRVWLIGRGDARFNPIHGADLAEVCVGCFASEADEALDVGGPDTLTLREVGALAFEALGRPARFGRVPAWILRALARAVAPLNVNLGSFLAMMTALGGDTDAVAPAHGVRHLHAFFEEAARRG